MAYIDEQLDEVVMKLAPREVKIINLLNEYECDECKNGVMICDKSSMSMMYAEGRILFRHVCSNCKNELNLDEQYPFITVRYE